MKPQHRRRHDGDESGTVGRTASSGMRLAVAVLTAGLAAGCGPREPADQAAGPAAAVAIAPASEARIRGFCGDCHALPRPASFPRESWYKEVRQGFDLYLATGRSDLVRPVERDAIRFFAASAPERLDVPRAADREEPPPPLRFEAVPLPEGLYRRGPAIAQVMREDDGGILTTDMRHGEITRWKSVPDGWTADVVARVDHPCRLVPWPRAPGGANADVRSDAGTGFLLADLGSFLPEDHDRGGVFALDAAAGGSPRRLVGGLSRVVEAVPGDFDGDGRDDLVVAEFGWLSTGGLRLLLTGGVDVSVTGPVGLTAAAARSARGVARPAMAAGYHEQVLDARHGPLGVRLADLDGDGRDDIVTAFAQEHETIDVWWNRGGGRLEHACLLALPDPSYGSSSFDVADLDGDGRLDIVHANGDTMDSGLAKPYHAIRRLLNRGEAGFEVEELAAMVGVCQVTAADVDLDGDQDIVASSLHPAADQEPAGTFDSLIWLEQVPGGYRRHGIERDRCEHAAFAITDVDGDGRPDIVAGCWRTDDDEDPRAPLAVFLNRALNQSLDRAAVP